MAKKPGRVAASVAPTQTAGVPGFVHYGGFIASPERRAELAGSQKWLQFADILTNFSIVAAGTRHFLGLIARTEWTVEPAGDENSGANFKAAAEEAAAFVQSCMFDMVSPWAKVMRRAAMYRFHGFNVQEWTAKRRDDGRIGLLDIAPRPVHTIDRWEIDEASGAVLGMWQTNPQTGRAIFLPRSKVFYLVEDSLTDNPEGLGLYRHLIEPAKRLEEYLRLEQIGFQRDLRGIPLGRAPLTKIEALVASGQLPRDKARDMISGLERLVTMQSKAEDTGVVLDSQTYEGATNDGVTVSGAKQWDIEILSGNPTGMETVANAINRLNREMGRILGVEQLLLGEGAGTRSLSEDKTSNFFLMVEGTLADLAESAEKDLVDTLWNLNALDPELKPTLRYEAVQFKDVAKITAALRDMATAGATLAPDDPAINDVRSLLGVSDAPELDDEIIDAMQRQAAGLGNPNALPDPDAEPVEQPRGRAGKANVKEDA